MGAPAFTVGDVRFRLAPEYVPVGRVTHRQSGLEARNRRAEGVFYFRLSKPKAAKALDRAGLTRTEIRERTGIAKETLRGAMYERCGAGAAAKIAIHSGMRQGELLALKWQDVDLSEVAGTVQVRRTLTKNGGRLLLGEPKTAKGRRKIKLTARATATLRAHRKRQAEERLATGGLWSDQGLVFASETARSSTPPPLRQRSFASLLKRAGLPEIRFHDLRHTCATLLLGRGVHAKFVQELLGHANISITLDTYSHVLPGMGDQTARAMEDTLNEQVLPEQGASEG
jgi:integrase